MARCRKILANGKRCKASAISGTRYCVFHTTGKKFVRTKKKVRETEPQVESKTRLRRMTENQIVGRGTKKLGALMTARGAYYASNKAIYDVTYRHNPARYNVQGTRIVGAHTQKTIEMRRTNGGRDFVATQTRKNPYGRPHHVHMGNKIYSYGRIVPVIGLGYVMVNSLTGSSGAPPLREGEGWGPAMAGYAMYDAGTLIASGYTGTQTLDAMVGASSGGYGFSDIAPTIMERFT